MASQGRRLGTEIGNGWLATQARKGWRLARMGLGWYATIAGEHSRALEGRHERKGEKKSKWGSNGSAE